MKYSRVRFWGRQSGHLKLNLKNFVRTKLFKIIQVASQAENLHPVSGALAVAATQDLELPKEFQIENPVTWTVKQGD